MYRSGWWIVRRALPAAAMAAVLVGTSLIPSAHAAPANHASILLHIAAPVGKNPCGAGAVRCDQVVTAGLSDPTGGTGYFLYVLVHNADATGVRTVAGLEFGIEYEGAAINALRVTEWRHCGSLEFPWPEVQWPNTGSGNLITWDPENRCQTAELVVAGYFYVTPYSPATMRLTPRPPSGLAGLVSCDIQETNVYPRRLGWVSFGGATHEGDANGFNPCLEPAASTEPVITFFRPRPNSRVDDDDVLFGWRVSDDEPYPAHLFQTWQLDNGPWSPLAAWREFPRIEARNLERGPHVVRVRALDKDGEVGNGTLNFTTSVDRNLPPTIRIVGAPAAAPAGPIGLDVGWFGIDDRTPVDQLRFQVQLTRGNIPGELHGWIGSDEWSDDNRLAYPLLPRGYYEFRVRALDEDGDESDWTDPIEFMVAQGPEGDPPDLYLEGPGGEEEVTDPHPVWIAHGHDDTTPPAELVYSWRLDGGLWSPFDSATMRSFSLTKTGWHTVEVRARDTDGLVSWRPNVHRFNFVGIPAPLAPTAAPLAIQAIAPNPSRGPASLTLTMARPGPVLLEVYDIQGHRVRRLLEGERPAGAIRLLWDGCNDFGRPVASGNYLVRFRSGASEATAQLVIAR